MLAVVGEIEIDVEVGVEAGLLPPLEPLEPDLAPPPQLVRASAVGIIAPRSLQPTRAKGRMDVRAQVKRCATRNSLRSKGFGKYWPTGKKKGRRRESHL